MKNSSRLFPILAVLFLFACRSTKKLYEQGNYEKAFYSAIEDLKKNPNNSRALAVLPDAYTQASRLFLGQISSSRSGSPNIQKLDAVYNGYFKLQKMYEAIQGTPGAMYAVRSTNYSEELDQAAEEAAAAHYDRGIDFMDRGGKVNAQKAYEDFDRVNQYVPGYKDVEDWLEESLDQAITRVAVNNINQQFGFYNINAAYLDDEIIRELNNMGRNNYHEFYNEFSSALRDKRIDQNMDLMMTDIWFGSPASNKYSYTVSTEVEVKGPKDSVYKQTVYATVHVERQIVEARSVLGVRVTEVPNRRNIFTDQFPARYTWENLRGTYEGDARALTEKDKAIINGTYKNPPGYDELYRHLTRQIITDFMTRMRQLYRN